MDTPNRIEPLTYKNWASWKVDIEMLMLHYGCWNFIENGGKLEKIETKAEGKTESMELKKNRAYTLIYQNISENIRPLILSTRDGYKAWTILTEHFEPKSRERVIRLVRAFFGLRCEKGEKIGMFLCRVRTAVEQLMKVGHLVEDVYIAYQMISYLPEKYDSVVEQITRWSDDQFKSAKVEEELIKEESRIELRKEDDQYDKPVVFYGGRCQREREKAEPPSSDETRGRARWRSPPDTNRGKMYGTGDSIARERRRGNQSKSPYGRRQFVSNNFKVFKQTEDRRCYRCQRVGHLAKNCYAKRTGKFYNFRNKTREYSGLAETVESNVSDTYDNSYNNAWIVDTGATAHFCNNKNLFTEYYPIQNMNMSLATTEKETPNFLN